VFILEGDVQYMANTQVNIWDQSINICGQCREDEKNTKKSTEVSSLKLEKQQVIPKSCYHSDFSQPKYPYTALTEQVTRRCFTTSPNLTEHLKSLVEQSTT